MNKPTELVKFDVIEKGLVEMREAGNFLPDMTTKEGYETSKRYVIDVTTLARKDLEIARKEAKSYWISGGKKLDRKAESILADILKIEEPHKTAYRDHDKNKKIEKEKFDQEIQNKIDYIIEFKTDLSNFSQEDIEGFIGLCEAVDASEGFFARSLDAANARKESLDYLNNSLLKAIDRDVEIARVKRIEEESKAKQDELDLIKKQMDEQKKQLDHASAILDNNSFDIDKLALIEQIKKRDDKLKEEAASTAIKAAREQSEKEIRFSVESEAHAINDALIAKYEFEKARLNDEWLLLLNDAHNENIAFDFEVIRLNNIELAKQAEIDAENARLQAVENERVAGIQRQQEAQDKLDRDEETRKADEDHRRNIHRNILNVLKGNGISDKEGKIIIRLAASGLLPKLTINY